MVMSLFFNVLVFLLYYFFSNRIIDGLLFMRISNHFAAYKGRFAC